MTAPRDPVLLIANPTAGGGRSRRSAEATAAALRVRGIAVDLVFTRAASEVEERARAAVAGGAPVVAVAGGDGTLKLAARALQGSQTALALVPAGRGNDLGRALGVPRDPDGAAAVIAAGNRRAIDLGRCGGDVFVTVATFGFDAETSGVVHRREVPGRGTIAYLLAALRTLATYRAVEAVIEGDFGRIEGRFFLVATANTRSYGGGMRIAPGAVPDDGLFDVCAVRDVSRLDVLRLLPRVFSGAHLGHPAVSLLRTRELRIETSRPAALYADGEPFTTTPATLTIAKGALWVIVPASEGVAGATSGEPA
jgi:diacylglycerol kinase (ATP)